MRVWSVVYTIVAWHLRTVSFSNAYDFIIIIIIIIIIIVII